ncbi:hypothetical protein M2375_002452 [Comamonas sp. BIGb0152]|nr:hypothetical protein [Comamonas sp. BIGb0152]
MRKWVLWPLTIVLLLAALVLLMWAVQTTWLGSFPGKDKLKYATWAGLELGGAVLCLIVPILLWVKRWRSKEK